MHPCCLFDSLLYAFLCQSTRPYTALVVALCSHAPPITWDLYTEYVFDSGSDKSHCFGSILAVEIGCCHAGTSSACFTCWIRLTDTAPPGRLRMNKRGKRVCIRVLIIWVYWFTSCSFILAWAHSCFPRLRLAFPDSCTFILTLLGPCYFLRHTQSCLHSHLHGLILHWFSLRFLTSGLVWRNGVEGNWWE